MISSASSQLRLFWVLLTPSILSMLICSSLSTIVLVGSSWKFALQYTGLNDYLFGSNGIVTALHNAPPSVHLLAQALFKGSTLYYIIIAAGAVLIGLISYGILQGAHNLLSEFYDGLIMVYDSRHRKVKSVKLQLVVLVGVRLIILITWIAFLVVSYKLLLPYDIMMWRDSINKTVLWPVENGALSLILLAVTLHLNLVFIRLIVLRPRLFGSSAAIIAMSSRNPGV